jgi:hypothetical protein
MLTLSSFERPRSIVLALGAALCACGEAPLPPQEPAAVAATASGLYSVGDLRRVWPGRPCEADSHREFDFWLGDWDVFNASGAQVGTNRIEALYDGCVIAESWTDAGGGRGRSINAFDPDTGLWHQTWVSANPVGIIRMAGVLEDGVLVMNGERAGQGFTIFDRYAWTELEPGVVEQRGKRTIPALGLDFPEFIGIYRPTDDFDPAPETPTTACQAGGPSELSREGDFLVGEWSVAAETGPAIGTARIVTDLSGCLFEERFETPKGLGAIAFTYYDYLSRAWFRTSIDSEGERLELSGALAGGRLVLTGTEPGPGGRALTVRLTWEDLGDGRLRQRLETSPDGGASWRPGAALIYTGA